MCRKAAAGKDATAAGDAIAEEAATALEALYAEEAADKCQVRTFDQFPSTTHLKFPYA